MISVEQATALVDQSISRQATETVGAADAVDRVLAETIVSERDQPPFDRAMMDGVAISSGHSAGQYRVQESIAAAGKPQQQLSSPESCIEIMTGAPLPKGTDCVVPIEQVERSGDELTVATEAVIASYKYVHRQGSDHRVATELLKPGRLLRAPEMAVLVSAGRPQISVYRRPSVTVVASGDELVDVDQPIAAHQIRRSNDYAIEAMLRTHGIDSVQREHVRDEPVHLKQVLAQQLERADVLVLSGGVSMGKFDYLPAVLADLQVAVIFHRVSQRPGKPMWFGLSRLGKPVFALPGNPVSAMSCCRRYVVPALQAMMGMSEVGGPLRALAEAVEFSPRLTYFLPVSHDPRQAGMVVPQTTNTSGDFAALTRSAGFIELSADQSSFPVGHQAEFFQW